MKRFVRRAVVGTVTAGAMLMPAASASAAPVITGGLVNVTVVDLIDLTNTSVQVPITVAANICDVSVAVLAQDLRDGSADCSNETEQITVTTQRAARR